MMAQALPGATDDLAILCRSCGLCCDGSLFGRVALEPEEVAAARGHRLHVVPSERAFEQPCAALVVAGPGSTGCGCAIYDDRPLACRRFVCRLYDRHKTEGGPLEARLLRVRRVRELVARLEASGLCPADFDEATTGEAADPRVVAERASYSELMSLLESDFARARSVGD